VPQIAARGKNNRSRFSGFGVSALKPKAASAFLLKATGFTEAGIKPAPLHI